MFTTYFNETHEEARRNIRRFVERHVTPHINEWEEAGTTFTEGAFFFAPRGQAHGPHVARTEVISLTIFDGPLTVRPA